MGPRQPAGASRRPFSGPRRPGRVGDRRAGRGRHDDLRRELCAASAFSPLAHPGPQCRSSGEGDRARRPLRKRPRTPAPPAPPA